METTYIFCYCLPIFCLPETRLIRRHLMIFMRLKVFFQGGATPLFFTPWTVYKAAHVISKGTLPWHTPPSTGIEPGPQGGQAVRYPTELSWPGHREDRQWTTPLSYQKDTSNILSFTPIGLTRLACRVAVASEIFWWCAFKKHSPAHKSVRNVMNHIAIFRLVTL